MIAKAAILLVLVMAAVFAEAKASAHPRCVVAGMAHVLECGGESESDENTGRMRVDLGKEDLKFTNLQVALNECPFDPVELFIYGQNLVGDDKLSFSKPKELILRGVSRDGVVPRLVGFKGIDLGSKGTHLFVKNLRMDGCGGTSTVFDNTKDTVMKAVLFDGYSGQDVIVQRPNGHLELTGITAKSIKNALVRVEDGVEKAWLRDFVLMDCDRDLKKVLVVGNVTDFQARGVKQIANRH